MHVRPIRTDEIDLFVEAAGSPDHRNEVRQYLKWMFDADSMRPEWCFVAEEESGRPLGRVAFWTLPGMDKPFALVLIDVPWGEDVLDVGTRLLGDVMDRARSLGAREIEHVVDDPPMRPQFQYQPQKRIEILQSSGFSFRRETGRFERRGDETPTVPDRLTYRALPEVGDDAFADAIRKVSEATLDREIQEERERLGAELAAREFFDDAQRVDYDPSWWRLAYTAHGQLAGLVMPAEPPGFLTIFYIGVVPAMRGQGYVDDLLAAGTSTLLEARNENDKPLITDTDVANEPMATAFRRAGWTHFAGRREYVVDLGADHA